MKIKNVALKVSEEFNAQLIYDTCNESAKYNSTISKTALPHGWYLFIRTVIEIRSQKLVKNVPLNHSVRVW